MISRISSHSPPKTLLQGYEDLERPLVGGDDDEYEHDHGASRPGDAYSPPGAGAGDATATTDQAQRGTGSFTAAAISMPTQAEEIQEVSVLAKDASEILWEMVAMGESGPAMEEMRSRAELLQAQLRGLINDYTGGDEALYASAFESFDMLTRCLDDQSKNAAAGGGVVANKPPSQLVGVATDDGNTTSTAPAPAATTTTTTHAVTAPPPPPVAAATATAPAPAQADLISFD